MDALNQKARELDSPHTSLNHQLIMTPVDEDHIKGWWSVHNAGHQSLVKAFTEMVKASKVGCLVLHGVRNTGKSFFIRQLAQFQVEQVQFKKERCAVIGRCPGRPLLVTSEECSIKTAINAETIDYFLTGFEGRGMLL